MPLTNDIEAVNQEIRKMQFSRLIVFADVVSRYAEIVLKNQSSRLQTNALEFIITRGGSLTPSQLATIMLRSNYSITKLNFTDYILVKYFHHFSEISFLHALR